MAATGNGPPDPRSTKAPPAPRRIVLLKGDDNDADVQQVLGEYPGEQLAEFDVHQLLPQFAAENAGKVVAVEWQDSLGWQRFLWCRK